MPLFSYIDLTLTSMACVCVLQGTVQGLFLPLTWWLGGCLHSCASGVWLAIKLKKAYTRKAYTRKMVNVHMKLPSSNIGQRWNCFDRVRVSLSPSQAITSPDPVPKPWLMSHLCAGGTTKLADRVCPRADFESHMMWQNEGVLIGLCQFPYSESTTVFLSLL